MTSLYVVQTNPVAGKELEFAEWYDKQHLADVVAIPGFESARRYERSSVQREPSALAYAYSSLALYEFEGDPRVALEGLTAALANGLQLSPALAPDRVSVVFDLVSHVR